MQRINVISKQSSEVVASTWDVTSTDQASQTRINQDMIVQLGIDKDQISNLVREQNALIITLKDGSQITIDGFFNVTNTANNSLVVQGEGDQIFALQYKAQGITADFDQFIPIDDVSLLINHADYSEYLPWLYGAAGLGAAWLVFDQISDDDKSTERDRTPPAVAKDNKFTDDKVGKVIAGKAEANAKVIVKDSDGNKVGEGTVDSSGRYEITLDKAFTNGEKLTITVTDRSRNESDKVEITAPDTTDPDTATDVEINKETGKVITGKSEAKATIEIRNTDGSVVQTATANDKGEFSITLSKALTNGEKVHLVVIDAAKNESKAVEINAPDITAPSVPTNTIVSLNGLKVTGVAEANSTIEIQDANNNVIGKGTTDAKGQFTADLDKALLNSEQIKIYAIDADQNRSDAKMLNVPDRTKPGLTIDAITGDDVLTPSELTGSIKLTGTISNIGSEDIPILKISVAGVAQPFQATLAPGATTWEANIPAQYFSSTRGSITAQITVKNANTQANESSDTAIRNYAKSTEKTEVESLLSAADNDSSTSAVASNTTPTAAVASDWQKDMLEQNPALY